MRKINVTAWLAMIAWIFAPGFSNAQIVCNSGTAASYVAAICGTGISYSNVTLTGDAGAIAAFTGGISGGLGTTMGSGVVMSTGYVNTANALQGSGFSSGNNSGASISALNAIAGSSTYDGIILEFDFIPITSQIAVNFQFGSEEYNDYVDDIYNDAFAFFISGPGISGSQNIALVPSTSTPVTINTINNGYSYGCASGPCTNCAYYHDNCSSSFNNLMDGFTTVLTASQTVTPCQTYHIKLMLADGGDSAFDSWVFVQQNGLYSVGNPPLSIDATYPVGTALYEDCSNANVITFTIPTAQASDYSFNVTWGGTATPGADYGSLPNTLTILAGQTSVSIPVDVYSDGLTEGVETITVTYPQSVCANLTATINIDDAPALTVDAGPDASMCNGAGSVTLTASTTNGLGTISYSWDNSAGNTASVTVSPSAPTAYTVTATDQCGRTATDVVNVAVGSSPVVDAGTDASVCSGQSVTLTATGAVSYSWDNGIGAGNGMAVSPSSTTTYTVTGTDAGGCTATDQVTVTVSAAPTVNAGPDQTVCAGIPVTLAGSGATTYSWDNGVSDGTPFTPSATTTYTLTGTNASGCQSTDQVVVTVNSMPTVSAGTDQAVCSGQSVTLNGSGASSYTWNNGITNGTAFTPSATTTYTVTGTTSAGCQSTDQVMVTVNTLPAVNAGTDQAVCAGQSATLSGSGASTYSWTSGVTNGVAFTPGSTTTYTVTGTDANGCQNTDQVVVSVNSLPAVNAGADQTVCAGQSVTLTGSGAVSYSWTNGVSNGTSFAPSSTTTYTVTGTSSAGCQNTDQVTVTVNPLPAVNAGADQSVCTGGSVTLNASGAVSYTWTNGVTNNVAFTPSATATYIVTGTDANGCVNTDQAIVTVNPLPNVNAGADQVICLGTPVILGGSGASSYQWTNGVSNNQSFTPSLGTQTYTVTGTDANGCVNTDQVTVTVVPVPNAGISYAGNLTGLPGLQVVFTNTSSNATTYDWEFGNGNDAQTNNIADTYTQTYTATGVHPVILTASNGICSDTAMLMVTIVLPPPIVHIPNVFTPDGDNVNDQFFIDLENVADIKVLIVNRWGNVMCEYNGIAGYWDGKTKSGDEATTGTYFFTYELTGIDGSTQAGQGYLELFRK